MTPNPHPHAVSVSGDNQAEPKWETLEDAVRRLGRVGAWAPGAYVNKCLPCGIQFIGDKRALSCLPCAISALLATPPAPTMAPTGAGSGHKPEGESYQTRVGDWMLACFNAEIAADMRERCDRFTEEALELVQSLGYDRERVEALLDYVYSRPVGEPAQEVGGTMVCLAALCSTAGVDLTNAAEAELTRIWTKIETIRAKQAAKPKEVVSTRWGALPSSPPPAAGQDLSEAVLDGSTPQRDTLGRLVREAWVRWALTQPNPKASWLAPYDDLAEPDKEADRQIGEAVWARAELILASPPPPTLPGLAPKRCNQCALLAPEALHTDYCYRPECPYKAAAAEVAELRRIVEQKREAARRSSKRRHAAKKAAQALEAKNV